MKNTLTLFALLSMVVFMACEGGEKKDKEASDSLSGLGVPEVKTQLALGMVHENLAFDDAPNLSYAIYLPRDMRSKEIYPVLYCIDPKGIGHIPLNFYKNLADSFNVILVGCNTSKNGMSFQQSEVALNQLIAEVQKKYPVDNKVHLLGFSGGAKVAFHYADVNPNVRTVLYAGAVYPLRRQTNISILGFAGVRDMNYADMVANEVYLGNAPFTHQIIEWSGAHEFPTEDIMRDGFYFMKNDSVDNYQKKMPHVPQENIMREQMLKRKFFQAFGTKDLKWWTAEINALNEFAKEDVMFERLLGFIGLGCYNPTQQAIAAGDLGKADYFVQIYLMAVPDNEDAKNFAAQVAKMKQVQ